jgi:hypothetical protein
MSELVSDLDIPTKINNPLLIFPLSLPSTDTEAFSTLWIRILKDQSEFVDLVDEVDVLSFLGDVAASLESFDEFFSAELDVESEDAVSLSLLTESDALPEELAFFP